MTIKEFAMMPLAVSLLLSCSYLLFATATDSITPSKSIKFPESIIPNGRKFQLGFFNLTDSTDLFVGIWYYGIDPANGVIWVANREKPLKDSSGIVMISGDGNLVVLNGQKEVLWSSSVQNLAAKNTSAQLQDSGNLVLVDKTTGVNIWESFRQPTNVGMPWMEVGLNRRTGEKVQLTSWKSPSDPSIGNFSVGIDPSSIPQFFVWNNSKPYWRSGPWNRRIFIGVPDTHSFSLDGFNLVVDKEGSLYLTFAFADESNLLDFLLDSEGKLVERIWHHHENHWEIKRSIPETDCDVYGKCGPFGSCDYSQKPKICSCLKGFEPKNAKEWDRGNWTSGCVRRTPLQCHRKDNVSEVGEKDGFLKLKNMKVPDFVERFIIQEVECKERCQKSCSCIAYAYDANIGCMIWNGTLIDMQKFSSGGVVLYIRVPYSELDRKVGMIVTISGIVGITIISICAVLVWKLIEKRRARKERIIKDMKLFDRRKTSSKFSSEIIGDSIKELQELPLFSFEEVANATRNFDLENELGKGGFGPVYRGTLHNGQEIAVKRLSRASGQGLEEFINEVLVISNVQHRNLVRLLGCCVDHEEKILVYEYLANKSLDSFLFDPLKNELLDWGRRNILLDERLKPKISDFGMARIFGGDEDHANTRRIAGTYCYMSPEYAMEGLFSEKSDVFSSGVLLLEIVTRRRNSSFYNDMHSLSLVGYAWQLWSEGNMSALIDDAISDPCHHREALRCIHVGLLCVQEFAEDRPKISRVISMLNSEIVDLPPPKQPPFSQKEILLNSQSCSRDEFKYYSVNDVTISRVQGR
ncbi:hypothetical protein SLA2020_194630 [Shorea laevis]